MTHTIAQLQALGATVLWLCAECGAGGRARLDRIAEARGPDYDLTDRTAPCRTPGCTYWVNFYGQLRMRHWPLRTEAGLMAEGRRRAAWLAGPGRGRWRTRWPS